MKKLMFATAVLFLAAGVMAQQQRPSPKATAEGTNVKVAYGQPSKKDRVIFGAPGSGALQPYGQLWRTGANEATEITFAKDGKFGGQPVKAGTYTLWTIPGEKEWSVILNSDIHFWGTQHEDHKAKDFLTVKVKPTTTPEVIEKLTYRFAKNDMIIEWDKTSIAVPVDFK
jgi:Protein of unknown function (DUF2911)